MNVLNAPVPDELMALSMLIIAAVCALWAIDLIVASIGTPAPPRLNRRHGLWLGMFFTWLMALSGIIGIRALHSPGSTLTAWGLVFVIVGAVTVVGGWITLHEQLRRDEE